MNKKEQQQFMDKLVKDGYKKITDTQTYCILCGRVILWEPDENGTNISWNEYQEEMLYKVHHSCVKKRLGL